MKVTVRHVGYGCECGCSGHVVELEDGRSAFDFVHPYGTGYEEFAKAFAEATFPELKGVEYELDWSGVCD